MNAALKMQGREPMILSRADAYIGVLVDDLTGKGTNEPYRMMTSRAEYRLLLRQDNADLRLTEIGYKAGLASEERYQKMLAKKHDSEKTVERMKKVHLSAAQVKEALKDDSITNGATAFDLLKRAEVKYADLAAVSEDMPRVRDEVIEQVEISIRYEGYLTRQQKQVEEFRRTENVKIPVNIDYNTITGLRIEAQQKLQKIRPETLGAAQRISGVSPGDVAVLMIKLEQMRREERA